MKNKYLIANLLTLILTACTTQKPSIDNDFNLITRNSSSTIFPSITPLFTETLSPKPSSTSLPTQTPTPTLVPMDSFMQGVSFPSYFDGDYARPNSDWILENQIQPSGANWISVHFFCTQDYSNSHAITCGTNHLTTKNDVRHIVEDAHNMGVRVFMEIALEPRNYPGQWSGDIGAGFNENDWKEWFENYETFITDYAHLAEEVDIDLFSIGSELQSTTHREEEWRDIAQAVREVYSGPILFSADSLGYKERWLDIKWWDAVDAIGIHPYDTPLSNNSNSTPEEMAAYLSPVVNRLEALSKEYDRPVIITELGILSIDGISRGMGVLWEPGFEISVDLQEQADVFQAYFEAFKDKEWWDGVFWFGTHLNGTASNIDFSFFGKPAENIMRSYYGAPPMPTPTVIPEPDLMAMDPHNIFLEELENGWEIWPQQHDEAFKVDIDQHDISKSGTDIKITSYPFNGAWLFFPPQVKISEYQWLSFDIFSPSTEVWDPNKQNYSPIVINVLPMGDGLIASPFSANITHDSPFIEGGQLAAGKWQRVLIPLDAFGPIINPPFEHIVIEHYSPNTITIYLDNIQLLKDKAGSN
ncbi:hypothetical protein K9N50_12690 [bacterium]|nr:hypothetical protein [bacterium]